MPQLIKFQGHLLWTLRDLSEAFGSGGGICEFQLTLSIFGTTNCAHYFVLHSKLNVNCWTDICFHEKCWCQTYRLCICFVSFCSNSRESNGIICFLQMMFAVTSGVIVKHTYMYCTRNMHHLIIDKSLTSDHAVGLRFIWMPLFRHDSCGIL